MQQIRYFLALARELNFTRAAETCNVTQPALTRAIQALEAELGGRLFNRERNQTHLSELGRMMLPYIQSIQAQADAARVRAKSVGKMKNVELKLCAMCTLSPTLMADFIVGFRQANPGVDLNVSDGSVKDVLQQLTSGEREIAVLGHPEEIDDRFHALPLYRERYVAVLPMQHRLANQKEIHVADLDNEPYVNRINCDLGDFAGDQFARQGVQVKVVFKSERDDWVLGMIRSGMGWGFFPENFAFPSDVAVRPIVSPEFTRTVSLVTVRGRPFSPAVGAFVKAARSFVWPSKSHDAVLSAA
ncbi:LysR family transcriptional regulator [Vitreimonas sp.]|uniref:LysR family transcriptional regulator n=1 Tax=Vitreimonas sp. TaxID=3069702 RepID=UPI002EDA0A63